MVWSADKTAVGFEVRRLCDTSGASFLIVREPFDLGSSAVSIKED
jgi:hypothetical protein